MLQGGSRGEAAVTEGKVKWVENKEEVVEPAKIGK